MMRKEYQSGAIMTAGTGWAHTNPRIGAVSLDYDNGVVVYLYFVLVAGLGQWRRGFPF